MTMDLHVNSWAPNGRTLINSHQERVPMAHGGSMKDDNLMGGSLERASFSFSDGKSKLDICYVILCLLCTVGRQ